MQNQPPEPKLPETPSPLAEQTPLTTLEFRKKLFHSDMSIWKIEDGLETQEYFAFCTDWRWNVPDVTLHSGVDTTGPILGVSRFRWSRHVEFGIGDPKGNPADMSWEKMKNPSWWTKANYELEWTDPSDGGVDAPRVPRRRHFKWHRTADTSDGVQDVTQKLAMRSYRLTDQDNGQLVALFLARNSVGVRGELRIFQDLSTLQKTVVVLTCASIQEYANRE